MSFPAPSGYLGHPLKPDLQALEKPWRSKKWGSCLSFFHQHCLSSSFSGKSTNNSWASTIILLLGHVHHPVIWIFLRTVQVLWPVPLCQICKVSFGSDLAHREPCVMLYWWAIKVFAFGEEGVLGEMTAGLNYDGKGMCLGSSMRGLDATLHWSQGRNYEFYFRDFLQLTKSQFSSLWNGHKSSPYLSEEWVKSHNEAPRNGSRATDQHLDLAHSYGGLDIFLRGTESARSMRFWTEHRWIRGTRKRWGQLVTFFIGVLEIVLCSESG